LPVLPSAGLHASGGHFTATGCRTRPQHQARQHPTPRSWHAPCIATRARPAPAPSCRARRRARMDRTAWNDRGPLIQPDHNEVTGGGRRGRVFPSRYRATGRHIPRPPGLLHLVGAVTASRPRSPARRSQAPAGRKQATPRRRCRAALAKVSPPLEPPSARKDNLRFSTSRKRNPSLSLGRCRGPGRPASPPTSPQATRYARAGAFPIPGITRPKSSNVWKSDIRGRMPPKRRPRMPHKRRPRPGPCPDMPFPHGHGRRRATTLQGPCGDPAEHARRLRRRAAIRPGRGKGDARNGGWGLSVPRNPARYRLPVTGSRRSPGRLNRSDYP
jgi:hypothetical protein